MSVGPVANTQCLSTNFWFTPPCLDHVARDEVLDREVGLWLEDHLEVGDVAGAVAEGREVHDLHRLVVSLRSVTRDHSIGWHSAMLAPQETTVSVSSMSS